MMEQDSEATLACNGCRLRKLRCSRETPTCQQCRRTANRCVYETKRGKPGVKAGAVDNLHRRLDALEKVVHQQQSEPSSQRQTTASENGEERWDPYSILSFFAREFQRFNDDDATTNAAGRDRRPSKRRRLVDLTADDNDEEQRSPPVPDRDELELVLQAYFAHVHPWIPMLHEGRLRRRLSNENNHQKLGVVIRAMVFVAAKYIEDEHVSRTLTLTEEQAQRSRDGIVATAMRQLSVENLQALIMIAFDDIGSGLAARAWPIVGALSRNVEYLQLAVENEDETERLSRPCVSLDAPQDWTETEERRRVFWNIFNLDRLCSVTMGWNTSLTSDDVNRQLPCDGLKWRKEDEVITPYFGIWDKAAARIGNPLAILPSHYYPPHSQPSPQQQQQQPQSIDEETQTPSEAGTSPGASLSTHVDMSTVGAFAYSIEATESLSRVTTYFLQQRVNMRDQRDLSSWLTRFKELDLRLVHWKMLLPQKWKVGTSRHSARMDPNLTLAHITHNASMIMLHQLIAFPSPEWPQFTNRLLPSLCSADTCQSAAAEIAIITENYLKNSPPTAAVTSQFAFCVHVASRACLLLWTRRHEPDEPLAPSFWSLLESLDTMGRRWAGPHAVDGASSLLQTNLAANYARKLRELHRACCEDQSPSFKIHVLGYTGDIEQKLPDTSSVPGSESVPISRETQPENNSGNRNETGKDRSLPATNLTTASAGSSPIENYRPVQQTVGGAGLGQTSNFNPPAAVVGSNTSSLDQLAQAVSYHRGSSNLGNNGGAGGDLGAISQMLLDPQFVDMDRIISYDDGVFRSAYDGGLW